MISFPLYWIYPILEVFGGSVRGMGHALCSMTIIVLCLCGLRVGLLAVFSRTIHTIEAIAAVYPITWAVSAVSFVLLSVCKTVQDLLVVDERRCVR